MNTNPRPIRVNLTSLGCPKNTVDSERVLALLVQQGFLLAERPEDADVCLVNTCGFIDAARRETRDVLKSLRSARGRRKRPTLFVALGCLVEHAGREGFESFLQDADLCVPFRDYLRLPELLASALEERRAPEKAEPARGAAEAAPAKGRRPKQNPAFEALPRLLTGAGHTVSLKISEGCSNGCTFCAIPAIRGPQVDRPMEEVIGELRDLAASGTREVCLIAQDTSAYGLQRYKKRRLAELLRGMADAVREELWFRLMYVYPGHLDDEVLDVMAADPRFCRYVDMPLQHISDKMLQAMGRPCGSTETRRLLDRVRDRLPGVALRTAFIVGYPGETEDDLAELHAFIQEQSFDQVGVFTFSPEPGTRAFRLGDPIPEEEKQRRWNELMATQREISEKKLRAMRGRVVEVMVDGERLVEDDEGLERQVTTARTRQQAPEIDGLVILESASKRTPPVPGERLRVKITGSGCYDLFA